MAAAMISVVQRNTELTLTEKLGQLSWTLVLLVAVIASIGFVMLYSAAGGSLEPWAERQMVRFAFGAVVMMAIALVDVRFWLRWAYAIYAGAFALLAAVEIAGQIGMGAQRWIDLGPFQLQPSEVMKIAVVLALARYFHGCTLEAVGNPLKLILPAAMVCLPVALVMRQPDLGTAVMLLVGGAIIFFLAGVRWWKFVLVGVGALGAVPVAWQFLHDYQQRRILTFFNPENDPLGAGYHITQSKIALGSGGIFGKGFLQGTQGHLSFVPERQTDFIFTMLAEEFGLVGGVGLLGLYALVIGYGIAIGMRARNQFGRLLALGLTTTFFLYVFINIAMVMGLVPVVGVPLALISYGGTAMLTILIALGLVMGVFVHRDIVVGRHAQEGEI